MANATTADARAGFDIYKAAAGEMDLAELNRRLESAGHGPVKDRTLRHYRDLLRAGFDRYISVNRFDVARAATPYENASSSGRYRYLPTNVGVKMTLAREDDLVEALGVAVRIGDVGAQLVFDESDVAIALKKARVHPNQIVRLDFLDPHRTTAARVIETDLTDNRATIEVEYTRLQSVVEYTGREPLDVERFEFRLIPSDEDDQSADLVGRRIYYFLELLEASRAVVNEFLQSNDSDRQATPAAIERLRVESPAEFVVMVPYPINLLVGAAMPLITVFWYLQRARIKKGEADSVDEDVRTKRIANDVDEARGQFQIAAFDALRQSLLDGDGQVSERLIQLMDHELLRTVESLAEQDIRAIEGGAAPDRAA